MRSFLSPLTKQPKPAPSSTSAGVLRRASAGGARAIAAASRGAAGSLSAEVATGLRLPAQHSMRRRERSWRRVSAGISARFGFTPMRRQRDQRERCRRGPTPSATISCSAKVSFLPRRSPERRCSRMNSLTPCSSTRRCAQCTSLVGGMTQPSSTRIGRLHRLCQTIEAPSRCTCVGHERGACRTQFTPGEGILISARRDTRKRIKRTRAVRPCGRA